MPMSRGFLLSILLAGLGNLSALAQSYQTSFASQNYDRAHSPAAYDAGIVKVDSASGSADLKVPIGPGMGSRGLRWTPMVTQHFSPQVQMVPKASYNGPYATATIPVDRSLRLTPWNPGTFRLAVGTDGFASSYLLPDGSLGSVSDRQSFDPALFGFGDVRGLVTSFGFGSDVYAAQQPYGDETLTNPATYTTTPWIRHGSGGDLVMGLYDASFKSGSIAKWLVTTARNNQQWHFPTNMLVIRGEVAYLYAWQEGLNRVPDVLEVYSDSTTEVGVMRLTSLDYVQPDPCLPSP